MLGQLLDRRYRVVRVLATGGFGQTYIAQDTRRPGSPACVVKHLKPSGTDSEVFETAKRLFNSEAETLEQLGHHDQIPRLLAYFDEDQQFYLVQEFVEGHTLGTELRSGLRWAESQVIQLLQEVLSILEFVHFQGVIHRDIKPDNIIRRQRDNKLVLVDFGAVKQLQTQLVMTQTHESGTIAIGTPGYMPTEQGHGRPRPSSDIYALGSIGIQALTGLKPTQLEEDLNTGELLWQHLVSISPELADVLTKMVRYHFKDRYQTAIEALQALQTFSPSMPAPELHYEDSTLISASNVASTPLQQSTTAHLEAILSDQHEIPVDPVVSVDPPSTPQRQNANSRLRGFVQLLLGTGVTAALVVAGVFGSRLALTNSRENVSSKALPSCFATISAHSNIRSEPTSASDNIIQDFSNLSKQQWLPATGRRTEGGWIEVKLSPEHPAWTHLDVVANRGKMESCLKANGIPIQVLADSTLLANRPIADPIPKPGKSNFPTNPANLPDRKPAQPPLETDEPQISDNGPQILTRATRKYQSGDLQGAIALLKSIPSTSSVANQADDAITQWQQDWAQAKAKLNDIQKALAENEWDKVLADQQDPDFPNIKYWRDQVSQLSKEAAKKKAAKQMPQPTGSPTTNTPTVSPSPDAASTTSTKGVSK